MSCLYTYQQHQPQVEEDVFIAPGAYVIGDVRISQGCSVWYNSVIRGDVNHIQIGRMSNVQDNTTIHVDSGRSSGSPGLPTIIGEHVTIGHNCVIHACTIEDGSLIGMGATLLDGCIIGTGSVIGAGSLVLKNSVIPPFSVVVGAPGKVIKTLDPSTLQARLDQAEHYYHLGQRHRTCKPIK